MDQMILSGRLVKTPEDDQYRLQPTNPEDKLEYLDLALEAFAGELVEIKITRLERDEVGQPNGGT